jgi:hypothetical protein
MVVATVCFCPSGSTTTDLVSPQTRHLLAADACSTFKVHRGGGYGCRILRLHQGLTLAAVFGGGLISASERSPMVQSCSCYGKIQELEGRYM